MGVSSHLALKNWEVIQQRSGWLAYIPDKRAIVSRVRTTPCWGRLGGSVG